MNFECFHVKNPAKWFLWNFSAQNIWRNSYEKKSWRRLYPLSILALFCSFPQCCALRSLLRCSTLHNKEQSDRNCRRLCNGSSSSQLSVINSHFLTMNFFSHSFQGIDFEQFALQSFPQKQAQSKKLSCIVESRVVLSHHVREGEISQ